MARCARRHRGYVRTGPSILGRAFTQEPAAYLEGAFEATGDVRMSLDSIGIPYSEFAIELSAPSRGAVVWSIIRELGRDGVRARISRDNDFAQSLAEGVRTHPRLELITEPVLSICCFRYAADGIADPNAFNTALLRRLVRETPYLPSSTIVNRNLRHPSLLHQRPHAKRARRRTRRRGRRHWRRDTRRRGRLISVGRALRADPIALGRV